MASTSQNTIPVQVWFAMLSLPSQSSPYPIEVIFSSLDYVQLLVQAVLANKTLFSNPATTPGLVNTLMAFCKTITPGSLMEIDQNTKAFSLATFLLLICYTVLKCGFFAYIIFLSFKRSHGSKSMLMIWRWIFRLQGTVLYFLITATWSNFFRVGFQNLLGLDIGTNFALMVFSASMIIFEFTVSFLSLTLVSYSLPNKSLMAAKNQYSEALSLFQKFIIQVGRNIFLLMNQTTKGVLANNLAGFIVTLIRSCYYFKNFPHYKLKVALYHSSCLITILCIYFAYLLQYILQHAYNQDWDPSFGLVLWIIITIPLVSGGRKYVKNMWSELIIRNMEADKNMVIHRIIAIKDSIKLSAKTPASEKKYSHPYLLSITTLVQINQFLGITNENLQGNMEDFNPKKNMKKYMIKHIQELLIKYPNDNLIKLYIASYYAQKLTMYVPAVKMLQELKRSSHFATALTAYTILYSLQEFLRNNYKHKRSTFDLATYVEDISLLTQLKQEIFFQAESQIDIYDTLIKRPQDLGQVSRIAQKVNSRRSIIQKKIQNLLEKVPEYFLEPLLVCAHYHFVLNHASHEYLTYTKIYNQRYAKYETQFLSEKICQENVHHKNTSLLLTSLNKKDGGIIKCMSNSLVDVFGKSLIGYHECMISEGAMRDLNYKWINFVLEQGAKSDFDILFSCFQYDFKEECFIPCEYYHSLSPFLCQGLFLIIFIRFSTSNEECLIIEDNGDIIGFTKLIGQKLALFEARKNLSANAKMNISQISRELARANHAINMINSSGKVVELGTWSLDQTEAQDLHSIFTTSGEELDLKSLSPSGTENKQYIYRCKFQNRIYGAGLVRVITLQRVINSQASVTLEETETDLKILTKLEEESESEEMVPSEKIAKIITDRGDDLQQSDFFTTKRETSTTNPNSKNKEDLRLLFTKGDNNTFQENLSTSRKLLPARTVGDNAGLTERPLTREMVSNLQQNTIYKQKNETIINEVVYHTQEKMTYQSSQAGKQQVEAQLSKDFHNALNFKYYPSFFRILTLILYLSFIGMFVTHILFKDSFDSDIQTFQARKNVARLCISRTNLFTTVYGDIRSIWAFATGQQNQSDFPGNLQAPALLNRTQKNLVQLSQTNEAMMIAMDALDVQSRERFFYKNIRLFDVNANGTRGSFINMTAFQAVQKIVETGLRGIDLSASGLQDVIPDFQIVLINTLNDLLYESELSARFLLNSTNQQRDIILNRNSTVFVECLCFLIVVFIALSIAVVKQYRDERQNMFSITRLDAVRIVKIKSAVTEFQAKLQEENSFEKLENTQVSIPLSINITKQPHQRAKGESRIYTQKLDYRGISRKYQWHFMTMFILMILVSIQITVKFYMTANVANNLSYVLNQIYFSDRSKPRIRMDIIVTSDLLLDSSALIRNLPLSNQFKLELAFLGNVTHNITDILLTRDSTYDPIIQGVLFDNGCNYITQTEYLIQQCNIMQKNSSKVGLRTFLADFQSALLDFKNQYSISDKSSASLLALYLTTFQTRVAPVWVIGDLMTLISTQLDNAFSRNISQARSFYDVFTFIYLTITCILIHAIFINRVKEADNHFRNVIKVFPVKLVLSNFILKSYLIRTWTGASDPAKLLSRD